MPRKTQNRYIEELYDQPTIEEHFESLRAKGLKYRAKLTSSGGMLELEIFPVNPAWENCAGLERAKLNIESRMAQKNLNNRNTRRRISRLIHANFSAEDIWATFTYGEENMPADITEANRRLKNYFKRLRRHIKKHGLPELKYIYVTERTVNEKTGKIHTHHHVITNFADRDAAEAIWKNGSRGGRTHSRRLQPDDYGLEGLARYIAKPETKEGNRKGAKSYATSLNLKKPKVTISDFRLPTTTFKVSKRRVAEMAVNENKTIEILEENYTGYKITEPPRVYYSDYSPGAYIYARMIKTPTRGILKCKAGGKYDNQRP